MTFELKPILAMCSPQRVIAGLVFIPLLAYSFAPFRDMDLSFALRLVFWTGVMALALGASWAATSLVRTHIPDISRVYRDVLFALLILSLFAPSLWLLTWIIFTVGGQDAPGLLSVTPYGLMFATGLMLVRGKDPEGVTPNTPPPRLVRRLHASFQGQIYRLSVRDHYVDVVTSQGTYTIRLRFTDAIHEMEPVQGHCTHRSHWVVDAAIAGVEREQGKTWLRLCNNERVPVSRKYKPVLEAAGII